MHAFIHNINAVLKVTASDVKYKRSGHIEHKMIILFFERDWACPLLDTSWPFSKLTWPPAGLLTLRLSQPEGRDWPEGASLAGGRDFQYFLLKFKTYSLLVKVNFHNSKVVLGPIVEGHLVHSSSSSLTPCLCILWWLGSSSSRSNSPSSGTLLLQLLLGPLSCYQLELKLTQLKLKQNKTKQNTKTKRINKKIKIKRHTHSTQYRIFFLFLCTCMHICMYWYWRLIWTDHEKELFCIHT
jgi:hypothetical protein